MRKLQAASAELEVHMNDRTGLRICGRMLVGLAGGMVMMANSSAAVTYGYVGAYTTETDGVYQSGQQNSQFTANFTFTDALAIGVNNLAPVSWTYNFAFHQSGAAGPWVLGPVQITVGAGGYITDWNWSATATSALVHSYGPGSGNSDVWSTGGGYAAGHSLAAGSWPVNPQSVAAVPEPASLALVGLALAAAGLGRRRKR